MEENKPTPPKIRYKSLVMDNVKYRTLHTKKFAKRKAYEEHNPFKLTAFIPGTIIDISTKAGKKVKAGDKLLILEAMKMRNNVVAPEDCVVKQVCVTKGQKVAKDQLMIELE